MCRRTRHLSDSFVITHYLKVFQGQRDQRCRQKLSLLNVLILCIHRPSTLWHLDGCAVEHHLAVGKIPHRQTSLEWQHCELEFLLSVCLLLSLITSLTVPSFSNLFRIREIVRRVCGSNSSSVRNCRRTSWMFSYFQCHFSIASLCSNVNLTAIFVFNCLQSAHISFTSS